MASQTGSYDFRVALDSINRLSLLEPVVSANSASINTMQDSILSTVDKAYLKRDEFGSYQEEQSSSFSQFATDITASFTDTVTMVDTVGNSIVEYKNEIMKYFRFSMNGLEIGEVGNSLLLKIDNDEIGFYKDGEKIAYWDGQQLYTGDAYIKLNHQFRIGNFAAFPRTSGNISWLKVSD